MEIGSASPTNPVAASGCSIERRFCGWSTIAGASRGPRRRLRSRAPSAGLRELLPVAEAAGPEAREQHQHLEREERQRERRHRRRPPPRRAAEARGRRPARRRRGTGPRARGRRRARPRADAAQPRHSSAHAVQRSADAAEQHRVVVEHHARVDVGGEHPRHREREAGARALQHAAAHPRQREHRGRGGERLHEKQRLRPVVQPQQRRDHVVEQLHVVGQRVHAHHRVQRRQAVRDQPVRLVEEAEVLGAGAVGPVAARRMA